MTGQDRTGPIRRTLQAPRGPGRLLLHLTQQRVSGRPLEVYHWQTVRAGDQYSAGAVLELKDCPGVLWRIEHLSIGPWELSPEGEGEAVGEVTGDAPRSGLRLVG